MIRKTIIVVLTLGALTASLACAANWSFPLAVMQRVGVADGGSLGGVTWEAGWESEDARDYVWIRVCEQSVHLSWHRSHREAPRPRRTSRQFLGKPWPVVGIKTTSFGRPVKLRSTDGSIVEYLGSSVVFLELPLWGLCLIFGAYPTIVLYRWRIRRRRRRRGLCLACGYDLTRNESGVCPECGSEIEKP